MSYRVTNPKLTSIRPYTHFIELHTLSLISLNIVYTIGLLVCKGKLLSLIYVVHIYYDKPLIRTYWHSYSRLKIYKVCIKPTVYRHQIHWNSCHNILYFTTINLFNIYWHISRVKQADGKTTEETRDFPLCDHFMRFLLRINSVISRDFLSSYRFLNNQSAPNNVQKNHEIWRTTQHIVKWCSCTARLLTRRNIPKMEEHFLSAVRDCIIISLILCNSVLNQIYNNRSNGEANQYPVTTMCSC
jgi:hypothetical protein